MTGSNITAKGGTISTDLLKHIGNKSVPSLRRCEDIAPMVKGDCNVPYGYTDNTKPLAEGHNFRHTYTASRHTGIGDRSFAPSHMTGYGNRGFAERPGVSPNDSLAQFDLQHAFKQP